MLLPGAGAGAGAGCRVPVLVLSAGCARGGDRLCRCWVLAVRVVETRCRVLVLGAIPVLGAGARF